jgi:hypothetical protein
MTPPSWGAGRFTLNFLVERRPDAHHRCLPRAVVPPDQQATVLQVRQAIANFNPDKLGEIVDYIDNKGWH